MPVPRRARSGERPAARRELEDALAGQVRRLLAQPVVKQLLGQKHFMAVAFSLVELSGCNGPAPLSDSGRLYRLITDLAKVVDGKLSIGIDSEAVSRSIARKMAGFFSPSAGA